MALHLRGCSVVAGHGEHSGAEAQEIRYQGVHLFYGRDLSAEITVLTGGVGGLDMDEEEVIGAPVLLEGLKLAGYALAFFQDFHADEPGEALVHGVASDGRRAELVDLVQLR